ncbi:MAG TPA: NAD(P)H-hydrate dehydratase [Nitrososphaeraceae archaeon]|nr:NAD(P)H-hydrate dehydratase [Nitrososphaeraceae archaeon]
MTELISITQDYVKNHVKARYQNSKKGDNGIVLVIGGSGLYHGAPLLASLTALRAGADLVYTAVPRIIINAIRSYSPNIIALPMTDNSLTIGSANRLIKSIPKMPHAATIGMGMTISKAEALNSLLKKLKENGTRLVLDASALIPRVITEITETDTIITPHAGEFKRIFDEDVGINEKDIVSSVSRIASRYKITIILKGWLNVIADQSGKVATIKRSTPAMTVGGTGDVLAGLVAALYSKIDSPFDASALAVYFNGLAAYIASEQVGLHMVASDLIEYLPKVMMPFDKISREKI